MSASAAIADSLLLCVKRGMECVCVSGRMWGMRYASRAIRFLWRFRDVPSWILWADRLRNTIMACRDRRISRKIATRDKRNEGNEVGTQPVHVSPFSHISRFTRHGSWPLAGVVSILLEA